MKLGFSREEWTHLQKLYGKNVFENVFCVEEMYFQKWIDCFNIKGFIVNFVVILHKKPANSLKNWENEKQVRIYFRFNGDFKLGLFKFSNRKLLNLKNKEIKFQFTNETINEHKKIIVLCDNQEFIFYAYGFVADVSKCRILLPTCTCVTNNLTHDFQAA